jgi:hypothetical protein
MKSGISVLVKKIITRGVFFISLLVISKLGFAQTPGMIIKPANAPGNNVLDPDGDGYVSQKIDGIQLGFTIPPDNDVIFFNNTKQHK